MLENFASRELGPDNRLRLWKKALRYVLVCNLILGLVSIYVKNKIEAERAAQNGQLTMTPISAMPPKKWVQRTVAPVPPPSHLVILLKKACYT